jgi:hypothetical protein
MPSLVAILIGLILLTRSRPFAEFVLKKQSAVFGFRYGKALLAATRAVIFLVGVAAVVLASLVLLRVLPHN